MTMEDGQRKPADAQEKKGTGGGGENNTSMVCVCTDERSVLQERTSAHTGLSLSGSLPCS